MLAKARLSPIPLGSLPNQLFLLSDERSGSIAFAMLRRASLFPYSHPYPARVWAIRHTNDRDCKDAKPYKHTQHLILRKENVIANIINSSADKKQRGSTIEYIANNAENSSDTDKLLIIS